MEIALFVLMCSQFLILVCLETQWRIERKDLLDRLTTGQSIPSYDIKEKPPPHGGNMVTAGLKRAADQQKEWLKAGDDT